MKVKEEHNLEILCDYGFRHAIDENNDYVFKAGITKNGYTCYLYIKADTRELSFWIDRVFCGDGVFVALSDVISELVEHGIIE